MRSHDHGITPRGLVLAIATALTAVLVLAGYATGQQERQLQVQVQECSGSDGVADGSDCESQETTAPVPQPEPSPEPQPSGEVHEYDVETGRSRVQTPDGELAEESLDLELSPDEDEDAETHADDGHGHDDEASDEESKDLLAQDTGLPTVSTSGGSQFAGFGADLISGDEALSRFAVPPFLVPIYVAAGRAYDVPWNVLAAINQIETDFGRIRRQVSYAGALGWMQFMPGTWRAYGVDASGDGVADPFNPVDAIYAAARYLSASGAPDDMRRAVFAYNHADWYVDRVLKTAAIYGSLPSGLLAETGSLAFGRFPVLGRVSYGDDFRRAQSAGGKARGLWISGHSKATAIATQHVQVTRVMLDRRLAKIFLRDGLSRRGVRQAPAVVRAAAGVGKSGKERASGLTVVRPRPTDGLPKGFAISDIAGLSVVVEDVAGNSYSYGGLATLRRNVRPGAKIAGGDPLGNLPARSNARMLFSVRAAGGARVDPRPLVDGYRLQEAADFYHAVAPLGGNPFVAAEGPDGTLDVTGSQRELARRVLNDSGIQIYAGGREDISRGLIDKRVLGALLYLRRNGIEPLVTSLRSGHSFYTAGGGVSAHSFGAAVDIAAFNGQPVTGNQGPGSLTEQAIKLLMRLEGTARPAQLISLMNFGGPSFAMGDHHDHLHVGYQFQQALGAGRTGNVLGRVDFQGGGGVAGLFTKAKVSRRHEDQLSRKLGGIENPEVSRKRGPGSLKVEAEMPNETSAAERLAQRRRGPLTAEPTAAGARLIDVDAPEAARGDESYAIGTVDGGGLRGWSRTQTVVLRHAGGKWRTVGPPMNSAGKVVNPRLRALATIRGGRGYAVGKGGRVVLLRGSRAPLALPRATRSPLRAVDAAPRGRSVQGVAVGARGTAVRLTGATQVREQAASREAKLDAVMLEGSEALATGTAGDQGVVYRRGGGGWRSAGLDLGLADGLHARFTSLDRFRGELWVAGGLSDSGALGTAAETPIAARLAGGGWTTYCAGTPALAAVAELGTPTKREVCDAPLSADPNDHGAAGDVAATKRGVVVATSRGIYVRKGGTFTPMTVHPRPYERLALSRGGSGWALSTDGGAVRIRRTGATPAGNVEALPFGRTGELASIATADIGDAVLALAGGRGALRGADGWQATGGPFIGLRSASFADEDTAWATDATGALVQLEDGNWSVVGEDSEDQELRAAVAEALGGDVLSSDPSLGPQSGIRALDFAGSDDGYAVGGDGLVLRYDNGWNLESTPAAVTLNAVAATDDIAVAAGHQGVLIERDDDGWHSSDDAAALADGRTFTAVDALDDGTLLAAAGGMVLERRGEEPWRRALLQPAGLPISRMAGYRSGSGDLTVLALVGNGEELAMLRGDASGWRPVVMPAGMAVTDFALRRDSMELWAIGQRDGAPVVARLPRSSSLGGGAAR